MDGAVDGALPDPPDGGGTCGVSSTGGNPPGQSTCWTDAENPDACISESLRKRITFSAESNRRFPKSKKK